MLHAIVFLVSYLFGSVSFSVLLAHMIRGIDIRKYGSGNAGATNTLRVLGKKAAVVVLLLDVCKGIIAVSLATSIHGLAEWAPALCGILVIMGHVWPVYFRFRGGKGVATSIGVFAVLCFFPAFLAGMMGILCIVISRYVSLGSLFFVVLTPLFQILFCHSLHVLWASCSICALTFFCHRKNIVNLLCKRENKLFSK